LETSSYPEIHFSTGFLPPIGKAHTLGCTTIPDKWIVIAIKA